MATDYLAWRVARRRAAFPLRSPLRWRKPERAARGLARTDQLICATDALAAPWPSFAQRVQQGGRQVARRVAAARTGDAVGHTASPAAFGEREPAALRACP